MTRSRRSQDAPISIKKELVKNKKPRIVESSDAEEGEEEPSQALVAQAPIVQDDNEDNDDPHQMNQQENSFEVPFQNQHRIFVNFILGKKICSKQEAKMLYENAFDLMKDLYGCLKDSSQADHPARSLFLVTTDQDKNFSLFLKTINKGLDLVDMQLRLGHLEYESERIEEFIVLVNTMGNDDISTLCSTYSPNEIAYFKMILNLIMECNPCEDFYTVTSTAVLNAATSASATASATTFSSFTKTDAEIALGKFVDDHWLYRTREGTFGLGLRSVKELDFYLKQLYPDTISKCRICSEPIFSAFDYCSDLECGTRIHKLCSAKLFKNGSISPKCPRCSSGGNNRWLISEVIFSDKKKGKVNLAYTPKVKEGKRGRSDEAVDQQMNDGHLEETHQSVVQTQRKTNARRNRSRASSSNQIVSSSSEDAMIDELNEDVD